MGRFNPRPAPGAARYPLATIAAYGPDNTRATKLVVGVIERPNRDEPAILRKWTNESTDVREDPAIAAEVGEFLAEHRVRKTTSADRIIGCPHEEGIDYPMGRTCPRCPFWAHIDRFSHEPIPAPVATMDASEVLEVLSDNPPEDLLEEALESADAHHQELIEPLLAALDDGIAHPSDVTQEQADLFAYALYLVAKWRDARAYAHVIRWLSLPDNQSLEIAGDIVTEDGAQILAAVCDGNLTPIQTLILDRAADEYGRGVGIDALALLAAWLEVPSAPIAEYFSWLAREGLEREASVVWNSLAAACADIEARAAIPEIRRAYAEGLCDPRYLSLEELDEADAAPAGSRLADLRERLLPIADVAEATAWWRSPSAPSSGHDPAVGRNDPCPCGSGRKYKKCCGQ